VRIRGVLVAVEVTVALASALLLAACAGPPRTARVARLDPAPHAVWIADVAVLDVARGERIVGRDVRIEAGRIAAIEPTGSSAPPAGALVLSGSGATLVPGLVDMHGHVYASPAPPWQAALPDPEANLHTYLYSGVTTLFDPGDPSGDAFERRARLIDSGGA